MRWRLQVNDERFILRISSYGWIFIQKILILLGGVFWKILFCWRAKTLIFGKTCQIVRRRCQMLKQMRKKAHLYIGVFSPKKHVKIEIFLRPPPLGIRKNIHPNCSTFVCQQSAMTDTALHTVNVPIHLTTSEDFHWVIVPSKMHQCKGQTAQNADTLGLPAVLIFPPPYNYKYFLA